MVVNHPEAPVRPFLVEDFWRILVREEASCGRWPRPVKCVNEPNGFPAAGTYALVRLDRKFDRCTGCEQLDSRVVSVPASREFSVRIESSDRTTGESNRAELRIAKSNRREGRR